MGIEKDESMSAILRIDKHLSQFVSAISMDQRDFGIGAEFCYGIFVKLVIELDCPNMFDVRKHLDDHVAQISPRLNEVDYIMLCNQIFDAF